jgi:hypothetical protein
MHIVDVKAHILKDLGAEHLEDYRRRGPYKHLRQMDMVRKNWISFTALAWDAAQQQLYLGLTAFDCDLLYRFAPNSATFESLGFASVNYDPQRIKIHRGLIGDGQGGYYFGTAGLLDVDERNDAAGGAIYRYAGGKFHEFGIPMPHDYIQTLAIDHAGQHAYGVSYPVMQFFDFDLKTGRTAYSFYTASHFHSPGVDDTGAVWGTYQGRAGHSLFRYHPADGPHFFQAAIPNLGSDHPFTFPLNGPIDSFINGGDGFLYFGTTPGELCRLDPATGRWESLGKPTDQIRLSGLVIGPDGCLLGSYGAYNETGLFLYDRKAGRFEDLGRIRKGDRTCFMVHEIAWDGGDRVFAGETDTADRAGYLWETKLG